MLGKPHSFVHFNIQSFEEGLGDIEVKNNIFFDDLVLFHADGIDLKG
tara:strand:- start:496 stop:636 length:141 start_codon:yes stop_codon:yes gene_type:complete